MKSLADCRPLIEAALVFAGGTHTFEDVAQEVEAGTAQFWPGPHSCIVTQVDEQPSRSILVFFLAAGNADELRAMEPLVIQWGQEQGCTLARMVGRKGWKRSFLTHIGWRDTDYVVLEKEIDL